MLSTRVYGAMEDTYRRPSYAKLVVGRFRKFPGKEKPARFFNRKLVNTSDEDETPGYFGLDVDPSMALVPCDKAAASKNTPKPICKRLCARMWSCEGMSGSSATETNSCDSSDQTTDGCSDEEEFMGDSRAATMSYHEDNETRKKSYVGDTSHDDTTDGNASWTICQKGFLDSERGTLNPSKVYHKVNISSEKNQAMTSSSNGGVQVSFRVVGNCSDSDPKPQHLASQPKTPSPSQSQTLGTQISKPLDATVTYPCYVASPNPISNTDRMLLSGPSGSFSKVCISSCESKSERTAKMNCSEVPAQEKVQDEGYDSEKAVSEANARWSEFYDSVCPSDDTMKSVHFPTDSSLQNIHRLIHWAYAHQAARKGCWERFACDRFRFKRRVQETGEVLEPMLLAKLDEINKGSHPRYLVT